MKIADLFAKLGFEHDPKPLEAFGKQLEGIKRRLEFLGAAEALRGIREMTEKFGSFATGIINTAHSVGVTTDELQGLQYAFQKSGASAEDVTGALGSLTKNLFEARRGSGDAIESFRLVGIPAYQIASFHNASDALKAVSDRMAQIEDPIEKQVLAQRLLGSSSAGMIAAMSQGGEALAKTSAGARKVGEANLHALHQAEEALTALGSLVRDVGATVASYFAPAVREAVQATLSWWGAHKKLMGENIKKWAYDITYAFGYVYGIVEGLTNKFLRFAAAHPVLVEWGAKVLGAFLLLSLGAGVLVKAVAALEGIFGTLATAMGLVATVGKVAFNPIIWFGGLAKRAMAALALRLAVLTSTAFPALSEAILGIGAAIEATPVGWIITAIAALIIVLHDAYAMIFQGKSFKETWLGQAWEALKGVGGWVKDKLGITDREKQAGDVSPEAIAKEQAGKAVVYAPVTPEMMAQMANAPGGLPLTPPGAPPPGPSVQDPGAIVPTTINAPVTINVPPGTPPEATAAAVKAGVREHLDRVQRETRRALRTSQAY